MKRTSHLNTHHGEGGPKGRTPTAKAQGRSILGEFKEQKERWGGWSEMGERKRSEIRSEKRR